MTTTDDNNQYTYHNNNDSDLTTEQKEHLKSEYHKQVCIPRLSSSHDNNIVQVDENDTLDTSQQNISNNDNTHTQTQQQQQQQPVNSSTLYNNNGSNNIDTNNTQQQHVQSLPRLNSLTSPTSIHRSSRVNSIVEYCSSPIHKNKCTEQLCCKHSNLCEFDGYHWYFAIGSMCNPTSLKLRGITPVESYPAILYGWRIVFDGMAGMANVMKDDTASFHGILHRITHDEMIVLDRIEGSYYRLEVNVVLYDGRRQCATVYKMDETKLDRTKPAGLPSERYIDIITQGLKHFNADTQYIDWLKQQPCVPRKQPHEYNKLVLPCTDECRDYTLDELSQYDGKDGRDMMIAVNGKVLKWVGDLSNPQSKLQYEYTAGRYAGTDLTFKWSRMLYEPKYKIASCYSEMDDEHKQWVEDMFAERLSNNQQPNYICVGRLVDLHKTPLPSPNKPHNHKTTQQTIHTLNGDLTITQQSCQCKGPCSCNTKNNNNELKLQEVVNGNHKL